MFVTHAVLATASKTAVFCMQYNMICNFVKTFMQYLTFNLTFSLETPIKLRNFKNKYAK